MRHLLLALTLLATSAIPALANTRLRDQDLPLTWSIVKELTNAEILVAACPTEDCLYWDTDNKVLYKSTGPASGDSAPVGTDGTPTYVVSASSDIVRQVPAGTINGINDTFTISTTPVHGSEQVFVNGILRDEGASNDYTISDKTITFNAGAIPQTGDILLVSYQRGPFQFYGPDPPWKKVIGLDYNPTTGEIRLIYLD